MDFTHFLLLAIERSMVSNKFGLEIFYAAYKEAVQNTNLEQSVIQGEPENHGVLTRNNFFLAITMLAQALYSNEEKPFDVMYNKMLVDKFKVDENHLTGGRTPQMGKETLDILSEYSVKTFLVYIDQLKHLFTEFNHENFNAKLDGRPQVFSWHMIETKNTKMKVTAFLKMCRVKHLIPVLFNIESLSDFIMQTIPPITSAEAEYFEK
jgi:hypothetical protein